MNVLFLTDGIFPFQLGGMQKHSRLLIQEFARLGINLEVVHCGGENYSPEAFKALFKPAELSHIRETFLKFPKTDPFPGHYIRENKAYSKNAYFELEARMDTFDLIYAQGFTGWHFIKEKHRKQFQCPIFVNFHGLEMFQTAPNLKVMAEYTLLKNSVKWNLRNADFIYSFGGQIDNILKDLGVHEDRIIPQSNGIDESWLQGEMKPVHAVKRFIFVGRAERRKGIEELTKVLSELAGTDLPFEFTFVGPIADKAKIVSPKIKYLGEIRDVEELKSILREHDCLVCPSHSEGMPTVILEAMACSLAIIATNVGAISRLLNGNGILLDRPEPKLLKSALEELVVLDEHMWLQLKAQSLKIAKTNFVWSAIAQQKVNDFNVVLGELKTEKS